MARTIENYQDLQDVVADWLNRADLAQVIPTFIFLAERKIFRWYRNANNEKKYSVDMRAEPSTAPDTSQVLLSPQIDLPADYLETLILTALVWNGDSALEPPLQASGRPLQRVSLDALEAARWRSAPNGEQEGRPGEPRIFARDRDALIIHPAPAASSTNQGLLIRHQYYCDLSGGFENPNSDNNVLRTAPDMYLYAALLEAEPYLKPEDAALARMPIWKGLYEEAKQAVIDQDRDERFSGSNVEVQGAFGAGGSSFAPDSNARGWA